MVDVTEQTATSIKFKIPEKATGRMSLMVLTSGQRAEIDGVAGQSLDRRLTAAAYMRR